MSKYTGWLVVSQRTGYMQEGKDHAAKVFDTQAAARRACKPLSDQLPVPITYPDLAASLLKGSAFCFDTADGHSKFIKCLRNDLSNKPFTVYSQDQAFVRWRHQVEKLADQVAAPVKMESPSKPSTEAMLFNPAILVK